MNKKTIVLGILAAMAGASLANAQVFPGQMQRMGGPLIYNFGFRPFTIFDNGRFTGYGAYGPYVFMEPNQYAVGYTATQQPPVQQSGDSSSAGTNTATRTSDVIDSQFDRAGGLVVRWEGDPANVQAVTFSLLDTNRGVLRTVTIDWYPVEARFDPNGRAAYVSTRIEYVNGSTTQVTTPLRAPRPINSPPGRVEPKYDATTVPTKGK
jgi:hypothetical protein